MRVTGRSDLASLSPYRAPQLDAPVKLNTNESPYPPPDSFMQELGGRLSRMTLNRYPDRDFTEAREALAVHCGTLTDRIWLANGSNEILLQLLLAFGGPDRTALTFEPTYGMHSHIAKISGTRHFSAWRNPDYTMDLKASLEAIDLQHPDVVFLCSPNNPTGNSIDAEEVGSICAASPGLVILDEAYIEFSGGSKAALVETHNNLVITRSFSKAWRLAGARLGYLIASPPIIEQMQKVRLPYHLSTLAQAVALTALNHVDEIIGTVATIQHERERVYRELSTTSGITPFASDANFVFFRSMVRPAEEVWKELLDRGVLVRDFSDKRRCEGCLRVSIGDADQNEKFLEALYRVVSNK